MQIEVQRLEHPTYNEFKTVCLLPNVPAIIGCSVAAAWPAISLWSSTSTSTANLNLSDSTFNYTYFRALHGHLEVSASDCSTGKTSNLEFSTLLDQWRDGQARSIYVRDLHLPLVIHKEGRSVENELYTVPKLWTDDWMNGFYSAETEDDFRFVVRCLLHSHVCDF